jgi:hypothetical protein
LPNDISGAEAVLKFLAEEISTNTYLNLMGQYRPCYRAGDYPGLDGPITRAEFSATLAIARRYRLNRLDPDSFRYERTQPRLKAVATGLPGPLDLSALVEIDAERSHVTTSQRARREFGRAVRRD